MRIACPACAAEYEVPEDRVPPRKVVRCARCGEDWIPVAPPPEPPQPREVFAPAAPPPPPPALPRPPITIEPQPVFVDSEPERRRRRSPGLAVAWVLSIGLLVAVGWSAYARRTDVVRIWPASERAYLALGIPVRS